MRNIKFEYRITALYLVLGLTWILFTDSILENLIADKELLTTFQSLKGGFYVIITTLLLFVLARRNSRKEEAIKLKLIESKEKAEESDRLKTAFLANMSHEIRTPMNGILGFVSLLEDTTLTKDKYALYLNFIRKSSERLLSTINDIIEISKIESKQVKINPSDFNVNDTIQFLYGFFKPQAEEKGLEFRLKNELQKTEIIFYSDKNKLESVLTNFIKNSLKFTHEGFIEFGLKKKNGIYRFYVKDTGMGIAEEKLQMIFERFIQADEKITRPYEGSGLGLSIAKAYANLMGGKIDVKSVVDKGSTFSLLLDASSVEKK